mmetsp:Transcript_26052/g.54348  ORF Transcript_26052/g.54348 Transcript_26052/m.54348 type:complete len:420 (-) Transcript_26052:946-2205(-)|eukprot:CAMPEP_0172445172 /NCGR_PEP_ID=MMETSP1065-20121228/5088_1 /TAXON_ID=265537 /ORGANISM="Amphiprora paludosa, Strain CCMP125" /LENGTH=419 /DNA_ID=CAMNT_0013195971 /DNA_START=125 /DNA_END=1384 /DNA_ORIENTATION=-
MSLSSSGSFVAVQATQLLTLLCLLSSATTTLSFQSISNVNQKIRPGQSSLHVASPLSATKPDQKTPGSAKLDVAWEDLGFEFRATNSHVKITYKEGEGWGQPELVNDPYVNLHIGATSLHYGQTCFEGLKAFCHEDGEVYMFRPEENAKRMQSSCRRIMMPELPTDKFVDAVKTAVKDNIEYVPPYGSGGALYIRPLLFGSGPRIGLQPADEYTFLIMVIPVGDYYKGGLSSPVDCLIIEDFDRAAPRGVGAVKVAGNYAADLLPNMLSKKKGYQIGLYLDAATQTQIEEFSTSNFVGIDNLNKRLITPKSPSVLPSITNKSLMQIARDIGYDVQEREIPFEELASLDEILAVGTAVVVTPVGSVTRYQKKDGDDKEMSEIKYEYGNEIGPTTLKLYEKVRAIQNGEAEDVHGWNMPLN